MASPESGETGVARDAAGLLGLFGFVFIYFLTEMIIEPFLDITDSNK